MNKVIIYRRKDLLKGFKVDGHALYDIQGQDIVCAALSILTINGINTIIEILKLEDYIDYEIGEEHIGLDVYIDELDEKRLHDTQVVLKSFELGIISLISDEDYSQNLKIDYMEV